MDYKETKTTWHKRLTGNFAIWDCYLGQCFVGQVHAMGGGWFARSEMPCRFDEARFCGTFETRREAKEALEAEIRQWIEDAGL